MDEVAAQHANVDLMVHYGHACMTLYVKMTLPSHSLNTKLKAFMIPCSTSRLPVVYVFGQKKIDVDHCVQEFVTLFESDTSQDGPVVQGLLLKHDVGYTYIAGEIGFHESALIQNL